MVVRIRLARFGKAHKPVYNIVVTQARTARNSRPIEVIGTYDPIPKPPPEGTGKPVKDIQLDVSRVKYWLGVGAQPSDPMWRLLAMVGLVEPRWGVVQKGITNKDAIRPKQPKEGSGLLGINKNKNEKKPEHREDDATITAARPGPAGV